MSSAITAAPATNSKRQKTEDGSTTNLAHFNQDILVAIASYLKASDMVNLAFTSKKFGCKNHIDKSLVEVSAERLLDARTEYEKNALPQYQGESSLTLLRELELLRSPLTFDQLIGRGLDTNLLSTKLICPEERCTKGAAVCSRHIMRSGRHYATFRKCTSGGWLDHVQFGIIRPISSQWEEKNLEEFDPTYDLSCQHLPDLLSEKNSRWGDGSVHCCAYNCGTGGHCMWSNWKRECVDIPGDYWRGMRFLGRNVTLGLLLDLDVGTLTVYHNERKLGVMKSGLSGEYCWFVCPDHNYDSEAHMYDRGDITIKRGTPPSA